MYNRYLDQMPHHRHPLLRPESRGSAPSSGRGSQPFQAPDPRRRPTAAAVTPPRAGAAVISLEGITDGVGDFLGGILKNFSLDRFDTGDILLVLIILFLLVEGDDLSQSSPWG